MRHIAKNVVMVMEGKTKFMVSLIPELLLLLLLSGRMMIKPLLLCRL